MSDWVVVTYFPVKHLGGFLSTLRFAIAYFGSDLFHQRPDGKYVMADVLDASVALAMSEGSKVIALSLEMPIDEGLLEAIREAQPSSTFRLQLSVPPEVAGPLALKLLEAATELGFVPSGEVTRTDLPPK